MMIKKEFAKIGKQMMRQLSSGIELYHYADQDMPATTENHEKSSTLFVQKKRLSKTQISQFLLYHFLQIDERGMIRSISEQEIAEELNCTVRTVRNNNVVLEEAGLIYHSRSGQGINILIPAYARYFEESGSGFMELDYSRFQEMIQIENVNTLRLEIRQELIYDNDTVKRRFGKDETPSNISFNDFKMFSPRYTHYRSMISKIVEKGTHAFQTIVQGSSIFFKLREGVKNAKQLKEEKKAEYRSLVEKAINTHASYFSGKDVDDFVQLSLEYGVRLVTDALETLQQETFLNPYAKPEAVVNYGGKIRTVIRQILAQKNQEQVPVAFNA